MATQSGTIYSGAGADDTAFGLAANIAAAIGYILPILGLVFLLVEDENEFLRFNAAQSVAFAGGLFLIRFSLGFILGLLPSVLALVIGLLVTVINLIIFLGIIYLAYKAYSEETIELPVFADVARSIEDAL